MRKEVFKKTSVTFLSVLGVSVWEGAEENEVQENEAFSRRDDQKRIKNVFKDMSRSYEQEIQSRPGSVEKTSMSSSAVANERPLMLEKGNYIPWESRFRRFLDNKLEEEERMWRSIKKGPCVRPMIPDSNDTREQIIKPLSKMTEINKKQYIADVRVMNYLLQAIPNDIYNLVDACKTA
ncbi:hypothetical protein Tco_1040338 [Tanacetum coccineum]